MSISRRSKKWAIALLIIFIILLAAKIVFISSGPKLVCHRALAGALEQWMVESHTNTYPNIEGDSFKSISAIDPYFSLRTNDLPDYIYIPGLRPDDPTNLVMMYVKEKSRRDWHGATVTTLFRGKKWVVIAPDFAFGSGGELNDWIDTAEFKARLKTTIEFLKENKRPFWQNIVREQQAKLDLIKD